LLQEKYFYFVQQSANVQCTDYYSGAWWEPYVVPPPLNPVLRVTISLHGVLNKSLTGNIHKRSNYQLKRTMLQW